MNKCHLAGTTKGFVVLLVSERNLIVKAHVKMGGQQKNNYVGKHKIVYLYLISTVAVYF